MPILCGFVAEYLLLVQVGMCCFGAEHFLLQAGMSAKAFDALGKSPRASTEAC